MQIVEHAASLRSARHKRIESVDVGIVELHQVRRCGEPGDACCR
jgi:hypothetical protein